MELLKRLKTRGIETLLADYYAQLVAKPSAVKFFQVSNLDIPAVTALA